MLSSKKIIKAGEKASISQFKLELFGEKHQDLPKIFSDGEGKLVPFVLESFDENKSETMETSSTKTETPLMQGSSDNKNPENTEDSSLETKNEKIDKTYNNEKDEEQADTPTEHSPEKISHEAFQEVEKIKQQAFEEGKKLGYEEGFQKGMEEARKYAEKVKTILSELDTLPYKVLKDYKSWLVDAAFTIATHIVRSELTTNKQTFLNMLEHLVKQIDEDAPLTIYLNPDDMVTLRLTADLEEWAQTQGRSIKFKEDPSISIGSCRLETDVELLDATLENCIEELKREALSNVL